MAQALEFIPETGKIPGVEELSAEKQEQVRQMAARLNVRDNAAVMGFGARAQKNMDAFTSIALERMASDDITPLDGVLTRLAESIRSVSFEKEAKGIFRRVFGGAASLDEVRTEYDRAVPKIDACANELTDRRVALMRDSALLENLYGRNEELYRDLCSLLIIGEEVIRQARANGENPSDVARMERRVQDIRVTQMASTQLAAQIRMVQESDKVACERLAAALSVTIPLWKSQMAAALGLARATDSLRRAGSAQKQAEQGMRQGAQLFAQQKDAYAKASAESDRQEAQRTAEALIAELGEIEQSMKNRQSAARSQQT